jgi:hypothetical protein
MATSLFIGIQLQRLSIALLSYNCIIKFIDLYNHHNR